MKEMSICKNIINKLLEKMIESTLLGILNENWWLNLLCQAIIRPTIDLTNT